jgi:hypothetical protein
MNRVFLFEEPQYTTNGLEITHSIYRVLLQIDEETLHLMDKYTISESLEYRTLTVLDLLNGEWTDMPAGEIKYIIRNGEELV